MSAEYPFESDTSNPVVLVAETVVFTTNGISTPSGGQAVFIQGQIDFTPGVAATAATVRVRRGSGVGGQAVGDQEHPGVQAGIPISLPFDIKDMPGDVANLPYSITIQQTAATGNGTINSVSGTVAVGSP